MSIGRRQYPFHLIEPKWQQFWARQETFRAWNPGEVVPPGHPFAQRHGLAGQAVRPEMLPPKCYILDMFPYPSGAGLHVGHPEGYTATDIMARYKRAKGFNVLHPFGWDAFGLPAEQYAIKTGQHPRKTTEENIAIFKRQIQALGFSYDWRREIDTTDPEYYKWTQWIFLRLYHAWFNPATNKAEPIHTLPYPPELATDEEKRAYRDSKRLAYVAEAPVNWCPELGTVLANEEVIDGKSEVGGFPVIRRPMRQWMLRITAYAERLVQDLDLLDWSPALKDMQRNWIGRSEGADVDFEIADCGLRIADCDKRIRVFTTRPDTLFGATYMVLAPEHKLVDAIAPAEWPPGTPLAWKGQDQSAIGNPPSAIQSYRAYAASKSDLERTELGREKTGVFTGAYAINPVNQERVPIWIADYVLITYGTGAIMAVPAHDTRDLEFARKFGLPIRVVVQAHEGQDSVGFVGDGVTVNSAFIDGLPTPQAKQKISQWLETKGLGRRAVNYKLRDWLFSRQRYWGEPFPIVWKSDSKGNSYHEAVPENRLPVAPPELENYKPTADGQPPLARAMDWVNLPGGSQRETNTMPQWAGSCWYYLRYLDAKNPRRLVASQVERYWMGTFAEHIAAATETWGFELRRLVAYAVENPGGKRRRLVFGVADHKLAEATGLALSGFAHVLDNYAIRHILKQHGIAAFELPRGQMAVTVEDMELLPQIVSAPDKVELLGKNRRNLDLIRLCKRLNGTTYVVEEILCGRKMMSVTTMFKRAVTASDTAMGAPLVTSANDRNAQIKVSPDVMAVKPAPGVDLYVGGAEHAVLHLLYARFWHKALYDLGYVSTPEPFCKLVNQGLILGEMEFTLFADSNGRQCSAAQLREIDEEASAEGRRLIGFHKETGDKLIGRRLDEDEVEKIGDSFCLKSDPAVQVDARCFKMSKSRGNVINPDTILEVYGADAFRLYEMFMGPLEMVKPWSPKGVEGVYRFLGRVWRLYVDEKSEQEFEQNLTTDPLRGDEWLSQIRLSQDIQEVSPSPAQQKTLHLCMKKVIEDLDGMRFNTAISALMVFVKEAMTWSIKPVGALRTFLILLQPFAPHLAEELWSKLHSSFVTCLLSDAAPCPSLSYAPWPQCDPSLLVEDTIELPVQVNGKLRDRITVAGTATQAEIEVLALASQRVQSFISGKTVKKIIVVPKKVVNIAVG